MSMIFKQFKNPKTNQFVKYVYVTRQPDRSLALDDIDYCDTLGNAAKLINREIIDLLEDNGYESIEILKTKGEFNDVRGIEDKW